MKRQTLAVIGAGLIGVAVFGDIDVPEPLKRWVSPLAATENHQAEALRPIIDCLNYADGHWRRAYEQYRKRASGHDTANRVQPLPGPQLSLADYHEKRPGLCMLDDAQTKAVKRYLPHLFELQRRYANQLVEVYVASQKFDFYPDSTAPALTAAERDVRFLPLAQSLINTSNELRAAVDQADRRIRLEQLAQLQARGKQQLALVPQWILQTRDTTSALNHLEPYPLAEAVKSLQSAWDSAKQALQQPDPQALHLWKQVEQPGNDYLLALQQFSQHQQEHAGPAQRDIDYAETLRRFDLLVDTYNQAARDDF